MSLLAKNPKGYGSIPDNDEDNDANDIDTFGESTITTTTAATNDKSRPKHKIFHSFSWNRLIFAWFHPMLEIGNDKQRLDPTDLNTIPLPSTLQTTDIMSRFDVYWQLELKKYHYKRNKKKNKDDSDKKKNPKKSTPSHPSIPLALFHSFGRDFLLAGLLKLFNDMLTFVGPLVLNRLITYLSSPNPPISTGLLLTLLVTISQTLMSLCLRHYFHLCYSVGLRIRSSLTYAIYRHSLHLAAAERQSGRYSSAGTIVNLMSADCQRMQDLMTYLHAVWYSVLQIGLAIYFLWGQLGPSCLGGVLVILVMMPTTKLLAGRMGRLQKDLMEAKDGRVDVSNEVLASMKVVKIQAWEESFFEKILSLRDVELKKLFRYGMFQAATVLVWSAAPLLVSLATFASYVASGNVLDVASALTALALFDILRFPLFMLPNVINNLVEANVSVKRIASFLLCEKYEGVGEGLLRDVGVVIKNASFVYDSKKPASDNDDDDDDDKKELLDVKWELALVRSQMADMEKHLKGLEKTDTTSSIIDEPLPNVADLISLKRINFECRRGEFVMVVGAVGSGKSTLINSILGEVRKLSGSISVSGRIAYFSQTPFIMNDTLRGNVLFSSSSSSFNVDRYKRALSSCALKTDIQSLPHGDLTEIGEKGITLSGGQKARVAMARVTYHDDASLYLLDDPLAAVDAHVGSHMFRKCIVDELLLRGAGKESDDKTMAEKTKTSTVVLVTNALQYASHEMVDKIVVVKDGRIEEMGSYQSLTGDKTSLFYSLLQSFQKTLKNDDDTSSSTADEPLSSIQDNNNDNNNNNEDESAFVHASLVHPVSQTSLSALEDVTYAPEGTRILSPRVTTESSSSVPQPPPPTTTIDTTNDNNNDKLDKEQQQRRRRRRSSAMRISVTDLASTQQKPNNNNNNLMTDENAERETGHVNLSVYLAWARAAGSVWVGLLIIILFGSVEAIGVLSKWWLTYWSESNYNGDEAGAKSQMWYLMIYAGINMAAVLATYVRMVVLMLCGLRASRELFARVLSVVLHAPMSFFDTTPIGRIVNRFSKDVYTLDEQLVSTIRSYLGTITAVISVIVVITIVTPSFLFVIVPLVYFYGMQQGYFTVTYRELKRLDSVSRSPIYALLGETLDGVSTIRAFSCQKAFVRRFRGLLDKQQHAYYLTYTAQCWLGVRLELVGTFIISFACLCAVLQTRLPLQDDDTEGNSGGSNFAGLAGLSISFALSVTQALNWSVRMSSDLEANMVSVERIEQYCRIPNESSKRHTAPSDEEMLKGRWPPSEGVVEFRNATLRYRPGLPLVLKGLSFTIPSRSKVGVVGRTGAGKSTLMTALLRLVELDSGMILIDGVDIATVGLADLRSHIAVIPQDPVLFSGTVRSNLDPFHRYTDDELYAALGRVGLTTTTRTGAAAIASLDDRVFEDGSNFSVGQRQLLVIARGALLGRASVVIMDEATAAMDTDTDARIQYVIRTELKHATCITVAHRINTIMDSDYILTMDDGQAAEFDKPDVLLNVEDGIFKGLVDAWEEEKKKGT